MSYKYPKALHQRRNHIRPKLGTLSNNQLSVSLFVYKKGVNAPQWRQELDKLKTEDAVKYERVMK